MLNARSQTWDSRELSSVNWSARHRWCVLIDSKLTGMQGDRHRGSRFDRQRQMDRSIKRACSKRNRIAGPDVDSRFSPRRTICHDRSDGQTRNGTIAESSLSFLLSTATWHVNTLLTKYFHLFNSRASHTQVYTPRWKWFFCYLDITIIHWET